MKRKAEESDSEKEDGRQYLKMEIGIQETWDSGA